MARLLSEFEFIPIRDFFSHDNCSPPSALHPLSTEVPFG
jgi:hypothetical protein